ncbi:MAG: hypothetical protein H0V12_02775 [Chloroflexi bacterium]|nr:hypothetical protein [Chloroflexota bacterium]
MAMVRITPMEVRVRCDWFDGRPRTIQTSEGTLPVVAVARVRDESAAYPLQVGPRTIFEVRTPQSRMSLTYQHRGRRWLIEGVDPTPAPRAVA